jgi:kumamolisin
MTGPEPSTTQPSTTGPATTRLDVVVLPGSERRAVPGTEPTGGLDPSQEVTLTVVLRRRGELPTPAGGVLHSAELAAVAGANPAELQLVERVLTGLGLKILSSDAATRTVRVSGAAGLVSQVFATSLQQVRSPHPGSGTPVEHRHRTGELYIPAELAGIVVAVLGLDDRPQSRAHFRIASAAQVSYTGMQLGAVYRFPPATDGSGQTLAIIELGGGYGDADLQHYFGGLSLPVPAVRAVGVDGAGNLPGKDPQGADGEVLLDIEVAGSLAPAASLVVYFAPNTDAGFLDAVNAAAHATPAPTAMSISWGQSEDAWTAQARNALDAAMADAAALGVTVAVAAGDDGSSDRATDGLVHVDFPAASPHALACGGTALHADPATGAVTSETVWQDPGHGATGGGVSHDFPLPVWQEAVGVPLRAGDLGSGKGRGVPDVAADADPATGYAVYVDGQAQVFGGTSAVAPLWAALVCRLAQALGRPLGLLQPALYAGAQAGQPAPGLRDITSGSNGAYTAGPGWDACTGLGVPDGVALLEHLRQAAPT